MYDIQQLPWRHIQDFLVRVESSRSEREFIRLTLEGIGVILPFDRCVNFFLLEERGPRRVAGINDSDHVSVFNAHWRHKIPFAPQEVRDERATDFTRWDDTEYVTDFLHPLGIWKSAYVRVAEEFLCSVHRGRTEPAFTERETAVIEVIEPHLQASYASLKARIRAARSLVRPVELAGRNRILSRREIEIAGLLAQRMSARQVGSIIGISPRTVERHTQNIYNKLCVRTRRDFLKAFFG